MLCHIILCHYVMSYCVILHKNDLYNIILWYDISNNIMTYYLFCNMTFQSSCLKNITRNRHFRKLILTLNCRASLLFQQLIVRYAFPNSRFLMARTGLEDAIQGQSVDIGLAVKEVCVCGCVCVSVCVSMYACMCVYMYVCMCV